MAKNTKLNVTNLKKEAKALDNKREFDVTIGDNTYKLSHDVTFRKTKQVLLLNDLIEFFTLSDERPELVEISAPYTALLIIKHFTTLDVPNDISDALDILDVLIDLDILDNIVSELPPMEVEKLYDALNNVISNFEKSIEDAQAEADKVIDKLENEEVKDLVKGD